MVSVLIIFDDKLDQTKVQTSRCKSRMLLKLLKGVDVGYGVETFRKLRMFVNNLFHREKK